jgi:hypothetical protein
VSVLRGNAAHNARCERCWKAGKRQQYRAADDERPRTDTEPAGSHAGGEKRFERPLMIVRTAVCRLRPKAPQKASKNGPVY